MRSNSCTPESNQYTDSIHIPANQSLVEKKYFWCFQPLPSLQPGGSAEGKRVSDEPQAITIYTFLTVDADHHQPHIHPHCRRFALEERVAKLEGNFHPEHRFRNFPISPSASWHSNVFTLPQLDKPVHFWWMYWSSSIRRYVKGLVPREHWLLRSNVDFQPIVRGCVAVFWIHWKWETVSEMQLQKTIASLGGPKNSLNRITYWKLCIDA